MGTYIHYYQPVYRRRYRLRNFAFDMFMIVATYGLWILWMIFRTLRKYW